MTTGAESNITSWYFSSKLNLCIYYETRNLSHPTEKLSFPTNKTQTDYKHTFLFFQAVISKPNNTITNETNKYKQKHKHQKFLAIKLSIEKIKKYITNIIYINNFTQNKLRIYRDELQI